MRAVSQLRVRQCGVRSRRGVSRHGRCPACIEPFFFRDLQRFDVLPASESALVSCGAQIAEIQMPGKLGEKVDGARDLPLHLLDLEVGGDAGLRRQRGGDEQSEQRAASGEQDHSAK